MITLHLGWGLESDDEIDQFVNTVIQSSIDFKLPSYIETHRATIFQDLGRILSCIQRNPLTPIHGDYSHLYCGGEVPYGGFDSFFQKMTPIIQRTQCFHGRISNGQSIQVDFGCPKNESHKNHFLKLWETTLSHWAMKVHKGDCFLFIPELGPPSYGYAITAPNSNGEWKELSCRWSETLLMKKKVEEIWHKILTT